MVSRPYLFQFPRNCPNTPFWLPIGLNLGILGFEQDNNPKLLNYFHGSVMAAFACPEHGFKVIPLDISTIMAKKAILAVHWARFGYFGIAAR